MLQPESEGRRKMEKKKISTEQMMDYSTAVSYLENLLEAFKAGHIEVRKKDNRIVLVPASNIFVEIEAKQKPEKESFSLEISWTPSTACKDKDEEDGQISIKAFVAGQDEKDEKAVADASPVAKPAVDVASPFAPVGEKKLPEEMKPGEIKNKK
jgi:amphi-Trp domain-containing protein